MPPGDSASSRGWKCGRSRSGPKKAAIGKSCGVGGVGGQRHFGKNCWIGSGRGGRGRTRAPKSENRKSKRRNGSSAECCARRAGRRGNWKSGPKGTRRRRESRKD